MTLSDISSYELAYQIRSYLFSNEMTEEAFADLTDFPAHALSSFLRDRGPEPSVSQIVRICNVLSISMDSLVKGPVQDKKFAQLIRKCHFAYKLKGTSLYSLYVRYLEIWQKRNLKLGNAAAVDIESARLVRRCINPSESDQGFLVLETAHIADLSHKLWAECKADTELFHYHKIFG